MPLRGCLVAGMALLSDARLWGTSWLSSLCVDRYAGLARTIHIRCIHGIFGMEITKYTVTYGVYRRFWPPLQICRYVAPSHLAEACGCTHCKRMVLAELNLHVLSRLRCSGHGHNTCRVVNLVRWSWIVVRVETCSSIGWAVDEAG